MRSPLESSALDAFSETFGGAATVLARAPGRVELLGNHTDYNGGLVLAAAIDRFTVVVGHAVPGREVRVRSVNLAQSDAFSVDKIEPGPAGDWRRYVRGVVWASQGLAIPRSGFEAAIAGNVPLGGGLSSSASLQAALAMFLITSGLLDHWEPIDFAGEGTNGANLMMLAQLLRKSENEFVGVASGLLDQFSALFGQADNALYLDCRTNEWDRVPLGSPAPAIVVCDSKTSRRLADGQYNLRRAECERVVAYFQSRKGADKVTALRDVTLDELQREWNNLDPVGRLRARHVLTENDRVRQGVNALRAGDLVAFGRLMAASHASSRDDFGNSSPALDAMVASAEDAPGFLGGKLSGAGWAGCTVNLVEADHAAAFAEAVRAGYMERTGLEPDIHLCRAAAGASGQKLG
jgi:galactokinase